MIIIRLDVVCRASSEGDSTMDSTLVTILTLISGISWTLVYLILIMRGFRDKTYGMPLFALTFNLSWEFLYAFVFHEGDSITLQRAVNTIWCLFDLVIVYTYLRYGRSEFPKNVDQKWFLPWSIIVMVVSFATLYVAALEFGMAWGARYSAFGQNLMMSVLFIGMLVSRKGVRGQSIYAAIFKWIGTAAPTIQFYAQTGSLLILTFGLGCFFFDVVYIVLLRQKFREAGLNPFTGRAAA